MTYLEVQKLNKIKSFVYLLWTQVKKHFAKKLIILYIIVIFVAVLGSALYLSISPETAPQGDNWAFYLEMVIEQNEADLANPALFMDEMSRQALIAENARLRFFVENDIRPFSDRSASNLLLFINSLFILILVITMVVASRLISDETSKSKSSNLMTLPVKRWKILTAKMIIILMTALIAGLIMFLSSIFVGWAFFGFDSFSTPFVSYMGGELQVMNILLRSLYQLFFNFLALAFCSILVVFLGIILKNGTLASIISIGSYLLGSIVVFSFYTLSWIRFLPFPNLNFHLYLVDAGMPIADMTPTFSALILIAYKIPMLVATFWVFQKQDI